MATKKKKKTREEVIEIIKQDFQSASINVNYNVNRLWPYVTVKINNWERSRLSYSGSKLIHIEEMIQSYKEDVFNRYGSVVSKEEIKKIFAGSNLRSMIDEANVEYKKQRALISDEQFIKSVHVMIKSWVKRGYNIDELKVLVDQTVCEQVMTA